MCFILQFGLNGIFKINSAFPLNQLGNPVPKTSCTIIIYVVNCGHFVPVGDRHAPHPAYNVCWSCNCESLTDAFLLFITVCLATRAKLNVLLTHFGRLLRLDNCG